MTLGPDEIGALSRLLDEALPLSSSERAAWLAELPASSEPLRPYLEEMLGGRLPRDFLASRLPALGEPPAGDEELLREGLCVGPYRLERELGRGGMGCVWLAHAPPEQGGVRVALKLPRLSWVAGMARRMARERDIGTRLEHPNIVRLHDAGVDARGWPYLAFEYVQGEPIDQWCRARALSVAERAALVVQVAEAVACAHAQQVIHRDLKPSNILVTADGVVRLLDFGIAKLLDEEGDGADATRTHGRAMTLPYASPEQVLGAQVTYATDIYSLGVLAYELLAGVKPFRPLRDTSAALEEAILNSDVGYASARAAACDAPCLRAGLDAVIARAMAREPDERHPSAAALAEKLRRAAAAEPTVDLSTASGGGADAIAWYQFGRVEVNATSNVLWLDDKPHKLTPLGCAALVVLIECRHQALGLDELIDRLPPDQAVDETTTLERELRELVHLMGEGVVDVTTGPAYRFVAELRNEPPAPVSPLAGRGARSAVPPHVLRSRTNLPSSLAPILGREHELAALDGLLLQHRVISIVAPGGMGKSCLAQHALHRRRGAYKHGICWVELATVSQAHQLPAALCDALGLRSGPADPLQTLLAGLEGMEILLCLDNAEYVIDAAARVVQLICEQTQGVRVVVTSQLPLNLAGLEQVFRLGPLATPQGSAALDQAARYGAVMLFAARAAAADHDYQLDERNLAAVIDICRRLDGLPLAIELAAARVRLLGEPGLAQALGEPLRVLTAGKRLAPRRQTTLRAALEWSHGLLSHNERIVFRRLSVFSGSFSLAMVEEVLPDEIRSGLDRSAVVDAVGSLVERSLLVLLRRDDDDTVRSARYRLLETPKAFAAEQLAAQPEEQQRVQRRHAAAMLAHFRRVEQDAWDGRIGIDAGIELLEPDLDNARAALAWLLQHDHLGAVRLAPVMWFALTYDRFEECNQMWAATRAVLRDDMPAVDRGQWFRAASHHFLSTSTDRVALARQAMQLLADAPDRSRYLYACAIHLLAAIVGGVPDAARKEARQALADAAIVSLRGVAAVQVEWAYALDAGYTASPREAAARFRRAGVLASQCGYRFGYLSSLSFQAYVAQVNQDWLAAKQSFEQLLDILDPNRDAYVYATVRNNWLALLVESGSGTVTDELCRETLLLNRRFKMEGQTVDILTLRCALEGRLDCAARIHGHADALYQRYEMHRDPLEGSMATRGCALAIAELGEEAFERLRIEGRTLTAGEVDDLIFGRGRGDDAAA